ncbi:hypothetical protein [Georgenia daeguensis]|uniref:DUF4145 domain-containing protein n=1 Tax=Georgenia daeguensis TaxID=908355 RepID=A0ABP6UM22_9MICO
MSETDDAPWFDAQTVREEMILLRRQLEHPVEVPTTPLLRDYAEHLGYVILIAAEVEIIFGGLVGLLKGGSTGIDISVWGFSGRRLTKELRRVAPDNPKMLSLADAYEHLHEIRNQLVHSIRAETEGVDAFAVSLRPPLGSEGTADPESMPVMRRLITVPDLVDMHLQWQDLRWQLAEEFKAARLRAQAEVDNTQ